MAGIDAEVAKQAPAPEPVSAPRAAAAFAPARPQQKAAAPWEDLQAEDPAASYLEAYSKAPGAMRTGFEDSGDDKEEGDRRNKANSDVNNDDNNNNNSNSNSDNTCNNDSSSSSSNNNDNTNDTNIGMNINININVNHNT